MNRPIVVLHVITRFNAGGTASWLYGLFKGSESLGVRNLLVYGETYAPEFEDDRIYEIPNRIKFPFRKSLSPLNLIRGYRELRRIIGENSPQIIVSHTVHAGLISRAAALFSFKRDRVFVHTIHGHLLYGYFGGLGTSIYRLLEMLLAKVTDGFIIPGKVMVNELIESRMLKHESQIRVINPPVFARSSVPAKREIIAEIPLKIGWLARISPIKGFPLLVEIAERLPNHQFHVGGNIQGETKIGILPKNLILHGWTSPDLFWKDKDLALLTSFNEAQPIAILEAGLRGIPTVACNVGSVSDAILNHRTGILVSRDAESYVKAIEETPIHEWIDMGKSARNWVIENYSYEDCAKNHLEFFNHLFYRDQAHSTGRQ